MTLRLPPDPASAPSRRWLGWLALLWLAVAALLIWYRWQAIGGFALPDTDDNIRFAQVRDWLAGQGWRDLRQHHLDPPRGFDIHWSRLVDLPLAGLILLLRPLVGLVAANKWAVALAPLLPLGLALLGAALAARRLLAPRAWLPAALLALCGQSALWMWMPLRIDHHGWQLALLILSLAGVADPRAVRGGVTIGVASAVSLAIGLEMLPYLGLAGAALALRWVADGADARRLACYGASVSVGCGLLFAGFASHANLAPRCDALSPVWLSVALLGGALAVALALLSPRDWRHRLALAALAGALLSGGYSLAWPHCLGRLEGASPELIRLWLGNVKEARPIYLHAWRTGLAVIALPLAGLVGAAWASWVHRRDRRRLIPWLATLAIGTAAAAMLLWQMRAGPAAQLLAVPGATALVWLGFPRLLGRVAAAVRVLGPVALALAASGLWVPLLLAALPPPPPGRPAAGLPKGVRNRSGLCGTPAALRPIARLPRATILTFTDFGPRLIATTHHSAIAGPYHRNGAAIIAVAHAFRGSGEAARATIGRHGASYVLVCPGMAESTLYAAQAPRGFYMALARDRAPAWLTPMALPRGNPLRLWRVAD